MFFSLWYPLQCCSEQVCHALEGVLYYMIMVKKLNYSNIYQEINTLLHFGIFYNVLLNRSVMFNTPCCIISSWLQKLIYSNIYQEMNFLFALWSLLQCFSQQVSHVMGCVFIYIIMVTECD